MRRRFWLAAVALMVVLPAGSSAAYAQAGAEYGGATAGSSIPALNPLPQVSRITGTLSQPAAAPAPAPTPAAPPTTAPPASASAPAPSDAAMSDDSPSVAAPDDAPADAPDEDSGPPVPEDDGSSDGGGG